MIGRRSIRLFVGAIVLWIGADLVTPTLPGAFAFWRPQLSVQAAVGRDHDAAPTPEAADVADRGCAIETAIVVRTRASAVDVASPRGASSGHDRPVARKVPPASSESTDDH